MKKARGLALAGVLVMSGVLSGCGDDGPALVSGPAVAVGPELQVNTDTTPEQWAPTVSSDRKGNFVVVWSTANVEADGSRPLWAQRFDRKGGLLGSNFKLSSTNASGFSPSISHDEAGNFVVVWDDYGQDGDSTGIVGRRFDRLGQALGPDFVVNSATTGKQWFPDVASDAEGGFVVVWHDDTGDGNGKGIFGQRFDRQGRKAGSQFLVNSYTTGTQVSPVVTSDADGNFVVAWSDYRLTSRNPDVFARRFDSRGAPRGEDFLVNTYTTNQQGFWISGKDIASDGSGDCIVVWNSYPRQDGSGDGVFGQRFDSRGQRRGGEFQINTYTTGGQWPVSVASDQDGNFMVTWMGNQSGYNNFYGQLFDAQGQRAGSEFPVNQPGDVNDGFRYGVPAVSAGANGSFVVVWSSDLYGPDYSITASRVSVQRFEDGGR